MKPPCTKQRYKFGRTKEELEKPKRCAEKRQNGSFAATASKVSEPRGQELREMSRR